MFFATWNCILIPIGVAFSPAWNNSDAMFIVNALIDIAFLLDIFVNFRTTFLNAGSGEEVSNPKRICINYIKLRFWIDVITTIPFDTVFELLVIELDEQGSSFFSLLSVMKLVRVLRLGRIIAYMRVREHIKAGFRLCKLIFFLLLYLHLLACFWFYIVDRDKEWIPPLDWVWVSTDLYEQPFSFKYLSSLYHAIMTLAGSDLGPRGYTQTVICAIAVFMGAIINANIFGELTVLL